MKAFQPRSKRKGTQLPLITRAFELLHAGRHADCLRLLAQGGASVAEEPCILAIASYAHAALGEIGEALAKARRAMMAPPSEAWALDLLGNALTLCHQPAAAYTAFRRAHETEPDQVSIALNLATSAGFLGHTEEAERAYDRIIASHPDLGEPYLERSKLRRQTSASNHVADLRVALAKEAQPWQRAVPLHFALGKELEDLGDYDGAFAAFAAGAALRRRQMHYSVSDDVAAMELIAATHDADWCAPAAVPSAGSITASGPVFIFGMPRSGSTLLERALGRHSGIEALGELQFFGQALIAAARAEAPQPLRSKADLIRSSASLDPAAIGQRYLDAVAPLLSGKPCFIDKLPINFLYAGLIARALPQARLIHIGREPVELCMAMFKTLFRDAYPFSYDLRELGVYHNGYAALMAHWRAALGPRLIEVDYSALVTDPHGTLTSVLGKLSLPFEEQCLAPEQASAPVMTASAAQVRQPIHTGSVGSAERYRAHLGPLIAALASRG